MFKKSLSEGQAGDNVGLLLRGIQRDDVVRGQVVCKPGSVTPHKKFKGEIYALTKEEGGRHTPFFTNYKPQFFFRTADITGEHARMAYIFLCIRFTVLLPTVSLLHFWALGGQGLATLVLCAEAVATCHVKRQYSCQLTSLQVTSKLTNCCIEQVLCIAGTVTLPAGIEMVMPGDNVTANFELIAPVAMEAGLRFALREGGRTVGAGVVSEVTA